MAQTSGLSRQRGVIAAAVLVSGAIGLIYLLSIRHARSRSSEKAKVLHRRNAVRRGHHSGRPSADISSNLEVTNRALAHLRLRNEEGVRGYGVFTAQYSLSESAVVYDNCPLLPRNLDRLLQHVQAGLPVEEIERARVDLHYALVENWMQEEYPEGHKISPGEEALAVHQNLCRYGILEPVIRRSIYHFNGSDPDTNSRLWLPAPEQDLDLIAGRTAQTDGAVEELDARETVADDDSARSFDPTAEDEANAGKNHNMLDLLYKIGADDARRAYFIHRGVECSSCGTIPIQGIRYHCSNCADFDLCETCESLQNHVKHHVFYKIRIPESSRARIKPATPVRYPGNPRLFMHDLLPKKVAKSLEKKVDMDRPEMDAFYEQFKCIAGREWPEDPNGPGVAIDRSGFDKFFIPPTSSSNLIYDRIFAFYDSNGDGLIGFEEFLIGVSRMQDKSRSARLQRIFEAYDVDGDGFVDRKDFLRMFRAYYAVSKELTREMLVHPDDEMIDDDPRGLIEGSAPISTAFIGGNRNSHASRAGQRKTLNANGDLVLDEGVTPLEDDLPAHGNRYDIIASAAAPSPPPKNSFTALRSGPVNGEVVANGSAPCPRDTALPDDVRDWITDDDQSVLQDYAWPPVNPVRWEDVVAALGHHVPVRQITDREERSKVICAQARRLDKESNEILQRARDHAIEERWRRREFYTDAEEGMSAPPISDKASSSAPPGYVEDDSSEDDDSKLDAKQPNLEPLSSARRSLMRRRSSSKVRFQDDPTDNDYETRSNASSRSASVAERWGGFEISEAEKDVGKEILFQAVQQGFNELLDPLFKEKEDGAMEAKASAALRKKHESYVKSHKDKSAIEYNRKQQALKDADQLRTEELLNGLESSNFTEPEANGSSNLPQANAGRDTVTQTSNDTEGEKPAEHMLRKWLLHDSIDGEADKRNGYGKLNYEEFEAKMVQEDAIAVALGGGEKDEVGDLKWSRSADLGKLGFLGSWLEDLGTF